MPVAPVCATRCAPIPTGNKLIPGVAAADGGSRVAGDEELADLFEHARSIPLTRDRVRIDKYDAGDLAAAVDAQVRDDVDRHVLGKDVGYEILSVTGQMREELRNAPRAWPA